MTPDTPSPSKPHTCHARGCTAAVKPQLLMCLRHWKMVPMTLQRAVWRTYRPGQCDDKNPSRDWDGAASAAIGYVARREGLELLPSERAALVAYDAHRAALGAVGGPKEAVSTKGGGSCPFEE